MQIGHAVLDEMGSRGNLIAAFRKAELEQLDMTLRMLESSHNPGSAPDSTMSGEQMGSWDVMTQGSGHSHDFMPLQGWTFEDALSGQQLEAVADSLNLNGLDWLSATGPLDTLEASLL